MKTAKISIPCPTCGSREVIYSCEPKCCFNHVCAECRTTFEPVTRAAGGRLDGVEPPQPRPECTEPAVACAVCESTAVYQLDDGRIVCHACGALLELQITEVAPA